jgi:hypothetical protein
MIAAGDLGYLISPDRTRPVYVGGNPRELFSVPITAPPRGPLGLVLWIDNQYAIASRAGRFGFGLCEVKEEQWLEVEGVEVEG